MISFLFFLVWVLIVSFLHGTNVAGIQNLVAFSGFFLLIMLSAHVAQQEPMFSERISQTVLYAAAIIALLTIVSLPALYLGSAFPKLVSGRVTALFLIIPTAVLLSSWRHGSRMAFWSAVGLAIVVVLTLSRIASTVILGLFVLAQWKPGRRSQWLRVLLWMALVSATAFVVLTFFGPFRERMFGADATFNISGVNINAMGRRTMWLRTLQSWQESPWVGKGPGVWSEETDLPTLAHPHNDYLRVLHDYGAVGFALFAVALMAIFRQLWQTWRRSSRLRQPNSRFHFAALLAFIGLCVTMLTDNTLIYVFLMAPLGIIIGTALGMPTRRPVIHATSSAR